MNTNLNDSRLGAIQNVELVRERHSLVNAICLMSTHGRRNAARSFLEGLSTNELEYIAGYFGAELIDPQFVAAGLTLDQIARCIEHYEGSSDTHRDGFQRTALVTHHMMILLEYLSMNRISERQSSKDVSAAWASS